MRVWYRSNYWLLGDGADEEAKRWADDDKHKKIVYSSPKAVEMEEIGNHLSPELPIPPQGFLVVVISENDVDQHGLTLGVAHWGGDGGWIKPKEETELAALQCSGATMEIKAKNLEKYKRLCEQWRKDHPDDPNEPPYGISKEGQVLDHSNWSDLLKEHGGTIHTRKPKED